MSCGVGHRSGLDPEFLWQWCRLAAAAPIQLLAWELLHALGVALKRPKEKKKKERKEKKKENNIQHFLCSELNLQRQLAWSRERSPTKLLPQELHSASQQQDIIAVSCDCAYL